MHKKCYKDICYTSQVKRMIADIEKKISDHNSKVTSDYEYDDLL